MLRRGSVSLFQSRHHRFELLTNSQIRQRNILFFGILFSAIPKTVPVCGVNLFPAVINQAFCLALELRSTAFQCYGHFLVFHGISQCAEHPVDNHHQDVAFTGWHGYTVQFQECCGRHDRVVVRYLCVVDHLCAVHRELLFMSVREDCGHCMRKPIQSLLHITCQELTVRPGIGNQLLLIQGLRIVQGLLGGIAEDPVGIPLQCGQVIEPGWFYRMLFRFRAFDYGGLHMACFPQSFGFGLVRETFA